MKRKFLFLTFLLSTFACIIQAQTALWADPYGGQQTDISNSVATDASGNIYVTGTFESVTLNFGSGIILTNSGSKDMFVAKFHPTGSIIWAKSASGVASGDEFGNDIAVDATGNVYVIGSFSGGNISFTGLAPLINSGGSDFYIAKFDATGTPQWAVTNSGGGNDNEYGNAINYFNNTIYAIGSFESASFNLGGIIVNNSNPPYSDVFVISLDAATGNFTWADVPKGEDDDYGTDIDVSLSGNIFITGYFESNTFQFPSSGLTLTNSGISGTGDIFIAEFSPLPHTCTWGVNPLGNDNDISYGITVDAGGDVYITGGFLSPSLSLGSVSVINSSAVFNSYDYFVAKCSPSSSNFLWANSAAASFDTYHNFDDFGKSLALDECDNLYVTGWYNSFIINFGTGLITNATNNNYSEIFVAKYNASTGSILNLYQGHEVMNDQGTGVAVNGCDCPIVTGWFNDKLNLTGTYLSHTVPKGTSDFYVGQICDYDCGITCDNPFVDVSTGNGIPIGSTDFNWTITSWPTGINPTGVVACPWFGPGWSYGAPLAGTQWISVFDSTFTTPQAPNGTYTFQRTFTIDSSTICEIPELDLCLMVDDSAQVFLNGTYIGSATSMSAPAYITATGYGPFINGMNTLTVIVFNTVAGQMAFDLYGSVCCSADPCDSLSVAYQQTGNCCYDIYLSNNSSVPIDFIRFSTNSGNATLTPGTPPVPWTISPSTGYPVNSFMVFPNTSGSFGNYFNLCLDSDPANNPQQINIVWMGIDVNQDTIWCYDTLYLYCPDTLSCDSCDNVVGRINTGGSTVWNLLTAPLGVPTGVAVPVLPIPIGWRIPFTGTKWISYKVSGGGYSTSTSAPLGQYDFQTTFCICDTCPQGENLSLHYCILVDDTADIYLNGNYIGTATSERIPYVAIANGPFNIGTINTLDVVVTNNPPYYVGFDFESWICCDNSNGIEQTKLEKQVNVYPNPVYQNLYLKSTVFVRSIEIFSLYGQRINDTEVNGYNWNLSTINLESGLYFVKIYTVQGIISKKVIIKH